MTPWEGAKHSNSLSLFTRAMGLVLPEPPPPPIKYQAPLRPRGTHSAQSSYNSIPHDSTPPHLPSLPLVPLPYHLAPFLLPHSPLDSTQKLALFTAQFLSAASTGNADTLEWLTHTPNNSISNLQDHTPRKWLNLEARDDEGNSALSLATALGHAEAVRVLVEAGVDIDGLDRAGWTPLHWSVQNNDIPLASYLLNHRASAFIRSAKGLRPRDLVKRGKEGAPMREVLKSSEEAILELDSQEQALQRSITGQTTDVEFDKDRKNSRTSTANSLGSTSSYAWTHVSEAQEEDRERETLARMQLAVETAKSLQVDLSILGLANNDTPPSGEPTDVRLHQSFLNLIIAKLTIQPQQEDEEGIANPFTWDSCQPDQMLVFALQELDSIFDVVITNMKPVRMRSMRTVPANTIFLCARFAHYFGSHEMLEELFLGAIERIELAVHVRLHCCR